MVTLRFALGVLQTLAIVLAFVAAGLLAAVTVRSCESPAEVRVESSDGL